jgi:hypothetical protein
MYKYITVFIIIMLVGISIPVYANVGNTTIAAFNQGTENVQVVNSSPFKATDKFGKIPLYFTANMGQVNYKAVFYTKTSGYTLWLTKEGMFFDTSVLPGAGKHSKVLSDTTIKRDVSQLIFIGANSDTEIVPLQETNYRVSKYPPVKPVALNYGPLKAVC